MRDKDKEYVATAYHLPERDLLVRFDEPKELRDNPNASTEFELEDSRGDVVRLSIGDFYAVARMFLDLGLENVLDVTEDAS